MQEIQDQKWVTLKNRHNGTIVTLRKDHVCTVEQTAEFKYLVGMINGNTIELDMGTQEAVDAFYIALSA